MCERQHRAVLKDGRRNMADVMGWRALHGAVLGDGNTASGGVRAREPTGFGFS